MIGIFGLGLVAAGVFVTDPGRGYPPGAPLKGDPQTWHGYVHGINAVVVFALLIVACFVLARLILDMKAANRKVRSSHASQRCV